MRNTGLLTIWALSGLFHGALSAQGYEQYQAVPDTRHETVVISNSQRHYPQPGRYPDPRYPGYNSSYPQVYYGASTYREVPSGPYEYWRRPDWSFSMPRPGSSVHSTTTYPRTDYPCRRGERCHRGHYSRYGNDGERSRGDHRNGSSRGSSTGRH